jgi:hypothetical protein
MNTELDNLWTSLGTAHSDIDTIEAALAVPTKIWVPSQSLQYDTGATSPAFQDVTIGSTRNQAVSVPYNAGSNIYLWHNLGTLPADWVGLKITARMFYSITPSGVASDSFRAALSAYATDLGDNFTSGSTTQFATTADKDVSAQVNNTLYYADYDETSTLVTALDFTVFRISMNRTDANYTYTGAVEIHGVLLSAA